MIPQVTVIVRCYNHEKYIAQCINSVLEQTYKNIELIVFDNGSTDGSYDQIVKMGNTHNFKIIRIDHNIQPGEINYPLSMVLKQASGEYISMLYSDDWYMPDKIERQIQCMRRAPSSVGLVYCHGYRYFESSGTMKKTKMGSKRGYVFIDYLRKADLVIPISPLIKKYCYDIIGTDHAWTGSEYDFFVMSQYVDFDYVDEHLVVMRDHDSNDAKNIVSVYKRVCAYDEVFFGSPATMLRAGKYASTRLSRIYLMFARDFAEAGDRYFAKAAFLKALTCRPLCLCSFRGVIMAAYFVLPGIAFFKIMRLLRSLKAMLQGRHSGLSANES